jgi:phage baseplate assembly protein W
MIPDITILSEEITETTYPSRTYKLHIDSARCSGDVDDLEAIKQAVYLILSTERYEHNIYSWDYGVELLDLIGQPMPYIIADLPRRITEALTMDDRIDDVVDFKFEQHGNKLHTTFTVVSNTGAITTELEVDV